MVRPHHILLTAAAILFVVVWAATAEAGTGYIDTTNALPSPFYEAHDIWYTNYTYDGLDRRIRTEDISVGPQVPPPDPGFWIDSFFDVTYRIEFDDGVNPPDLWEVTTTAEMRVTGLPWDGVNPTREFGVEILSLELVSPSNPDIILAESPTEVSGGLSVVTDLGGGLYHIDSFFDVFFDLSMHGPGGPWEAPDVAQMVDGTPEPATLGLLALGGLAIVNRRHNHK